MGAQGPLVDEGWIGHVLYRVGPKDARLFAGDDETGRKVGRKSGDQVEQSPTLIETQILDRLTGGWFVIWGRVAAEEAGCGLAQDLCPRSIDEKRCDLPENREVEVGIKRFSLEERPPAAETGFELQLLREFGGISRHGRRFAKVGAATEAEVERRRAVRLEGFPAGRAAVVERIAVPGAGRDEGEAPYTPKIGSAVGGKACWAELEAGPAAIVRFDRDRKDPGLAAAGVVAGGQPTIEVAECRADDGLGLYAHSSGKDVDDAFGRHIVEILIEEALARSPDGVEEGDWL